MNPINQMNAPHQTALFKQMESPAFYPHPAGSVKILETHISKVFLAGGYVYKIKKPLDLGFLDFTTLDDRKYFCTREVTLNRRLTRDVYLDVIPITCKDGAYRLAGEGPAVEYAVKMRRLPETCSMKSLLRAGRIHEPEIETLARVLTEFYDRNSADPVRDMEKIFETLRGICEENFIQAAPYAGKLFDRDLFQAVRSATASFLSRRKLLFFDRMEKNRFRDCHGDLRTGHVYFTEDGIQIIDCIEFNDRFRYQDVASDIAFLVMDIEFMGFSGLADTLVYTYARLSGDFGVYSLIDFYKCYRAMVRLKVNSIRLQGNDLSGPGRDRLMAKTRQYLEFSRHYILCAARPRLWVVCGMPATGKSTVAEALARTVMARVINSDVIRKQLFPPSSQKPSDIPFESGIYSKTATDRTYARLFQLARQEIEAGNSVIMDATFGTAQSRDEAVRLAAETGARIVFAECVLPEDQLKQRLLERETGHSVSDARISHYSAFKKGYEPFYETATDQHIIVHTEQPLAACVEQMLADAYKNGQQGFSQFR